MSDRLTLNASDGWAVDDTTLEGGAQPVQLAGAEPWRASVTVVADDDNTSPVFIIPTGRKAGGVPIRAGAALTLSTNAPVFGYSTGAGNQRVYVISESVSC